MKKLLDDKTFYLPSTPAARAVVTARKVQAWLDSADNVQPATVFSSAVATALVGCIQGHSNLPVGREKIWGNFQQFRCSESYQSMWRIFLTESVLEQASPTFFQYITDSMFRDLLKHVFPLAHESVE